MKEVISVKNLVKEFKIEQKQSGVVGSIKNIFAPQYKHLRAVDDISLSVRAGEMVGFIGPNGAGKSTTIKMMSGILFPDSGYISVLGYNPQKQRRNLAFHIGTIFGQKPQLWYHLPAIDTFNLFSKIYELDQKQYQKRLQWLLKIFEVENLIHQPVRKLSLGQRMRCELIASLLHQPKVLFLDEPTIGLDIIAKKRIRELIKRLNQKENLSIILTSHDLEDVEQICDRIIIINEGRIVYDGSVQDLREKYLQYKVIKVIFKEKAAELSIPGVKQVYKGKFTRVLEVDVSKRPIQGIIQNIVSKYKVEDLTVLDPPIEEIIERIYQKKV